MISRRGLLVQVAAMAVMPKAMAEPGRLSFGGSHEQGGLMVGRGEPGIRVTADGQTLQVSPQGLFAFGLAYDAEKPVLVAAQFADGHSETRDILPTPRHYDIQAITGLPEKYVEPPPEVAERMARERALITDARKRESAGTDFAAPLEWPCAGRLSGVYGSQRILNGKPMAPHLAVDVAAPEGTSIHAAADGIVAITDDFYLEGGFTLLDHGHGVSTCYLHQSKRLVAAGDAVRRGDIIGQIGHTGRATGPHTHWGLNWFQMKLDPSRATRTSIPPLG